MTRGFFLFSFLAVFLLPYSILSLFNEVETSHKGPYKHVLLDFKSDLKDDSNDKCGHVHSIK